VNGLRVVRHGLNPGEKIVINGLQRVKPGQPVQAETVPMLAGDAQAKDAKLALAAASRKEQQK
jgi:multidrug efflux system membrane fusion protein